MNKHKKKDYPKEYRLWQAMKARCYAPSANKGYYKENNIHVCERWIHSFDNFIEDMGNCPDGHSLDRINNLGNYEPDNCRWATNDEQARNKSNNIFYTYKGRTLCLKDWAKEVDVEYTTLRKRIVDYGYSFEEAIMPNCCDIKKNNTSGVTGVSYHKSKKKWQAYGKNVNGKQLYLGTFDSKEDAIAARLEYEAKPTTKKVE